MYVDYEFYKTEYFGNVINEDDFPRYEDRASDKLYSITMGKIDKFLVQNENGKLVLDESKISSNIKKSVCKIAEIMFDIDKSENTYRQTVGFENENGLIKGKVISSLSSGSESISYATNSNSDSYLSDVVKGDKLTQEKYIFDSVRDYLGIYGLLSQAL